MDERVVNLVNTLRRVHDDNRTLVYYAKRDPNGAEFSTMPVTPFVFEFFIYNSIYQVNWKSTFEEQLLVFHERVRRDYKGGLNEPAQQAELEKFLEKNSRAETLLEAFYPLLAISFEGGWTKVVPDLQIDLERGKQFFRDLLEMQRMLNNYKQTKRLNRREFFQQISKCRGFVYAVRNNIFHGSKTLGEVYEDNQRRRIALYEVFVRSLTSLFFRTSLQLLTEKRS